MHDEHILIWEVFILNGRNSSIFMRYILFWRSFYHSSPLYVWICIVNIPSHRLQDSQTVSTRLAFKWSCLDFPTVHHRAKNSLHREKHSLGGSIVGACGAVCVFFLRIQRIMARWSCRWQSAVFSLNGALNGTWWQLTLYGGHEVYTHTQAWAIIHNTTCLQSWAT